MVDAAVRGEALWRAVTYLSVAQLHLRANPLASSLLEASDVKQKPSGHWGTVPGTAWALVHVCLAAAARRDMEIVPILGAGHAGVVQRALAWLTGDLSTVDPKLGRDGPGFANLLACFPDAGDLGPEVHPLLPVGTYQGGWLGGAVAFAQGVALDAPRRVAVPIVGDGECETPTTAAAWLAQRATLGARVLPIVHLNGYRMGSPSLLGAMSDEQVAAYFDGMGWQPIVTGVGEGSLEDHAAFHRVLVDAVDSVGRGERRVVVLRCVKGWSGPLHEHKTPLTDVASDAAQRALLQTWLSSYRPEELFDRHGQPIGQLALALDDLGCDQLLPRGNQMPAVANPQGRGFTAEVSAVLRAHAETGNFKVFSPDEISSNRLGNLANEPWVHEVLAEEVLLQWLAGWTATGGRGVLISYEAFAPLLLTGLVGQIKQRRLSRSSPSINLLLTSYGWHNVYTHGDPSLVTALLGLGDSAVHVFTPADADRAAIALDDALRSSGRVNIIVAGKHHTPGHSQATVIQERRHGLAVWPHLSDPDEPDLTLVCIGDLAAEVVSNAVATIRFRHGCRVRVVNIHDMIAIACPEFRQYVGKRAAVLVVTIGHPATIWGLLNGCIENAEVLGWREPPHPMAQEQLAAYAGLDVAGVNRAAAGLLARRSR